MRTLVTVVLLFLSTLSTTALAQVAVVNVYQPLPGKQPLVIQYMNEAKAIHQALGVNVATSFDQKGIYRYTILAANWEAYGAFVDSLGSSTAWAMFQARIASNPAANQIDNVQLNGRAASDFAGGPGSVTQVTVWELIPGAGGTMGEMIQAGLDSKDIHERNGAAGVTIYAAGGNTMYYLQHFNNMRDWGRFRDTPIPEFQQYMANLAAQSGGSLTAAVINNITLTGF